MTILLNLSLTPGWHFMTAPQIGELVDGLIPLFGGVVATLLGFRVIGKKPGVDPAYDEKHRRYIQWLKIGGPLLVLFGIAMSARALF